MNPPRTAMSRPTRRVILGLATAAPAVVALGRLAGGARRHAALLRPASGGRSTDRCASCGSTSHAMLACPSSPRVV